MTSVKNGNHHFVNVGVCALKGHATYKPDEVEIAGRLNVVTSQGEAWRCLRCGDYIVGAAASAGPADAAPIVPRGRALRDLWIMRFIAWEKSIKAVILFVSAFAVWRFESWQGSFRNVVNQELPLLAPVGDVVGWNVDDSWLVRSSVAASEASHGTLVLLGWGLVLYALVEAGEAVGLFLGQRWGEYFAVIATGFLVPLEVYEILHHVTWFKILVLIVNLFLIVWLLVDKRLFGIRGGHAAYVAEHHEQSLLTIERASLMK